MTYRAGNPELVFIDAVWKVSNKLVKNCTFLLDLSLKAPYVWPATLSYTKPPL